jgi:hypothetical protein
MRPDLLLIVSIASIYGAAFHLWRGRSLRDLTIYVVTAIVGFGLGHLAGQSANLDVLTVGQLHVLEGSLCSWGLLFVARWLKV